MANSAIMWGLGQGATQPFQPRGRESVLDQAWLSRARLRRLAATVPPVALLLLLLLLAVPLCASAASAQTFRGGLLQSGSEEAPSDKGSVRGGLMQEGRAGRRGLEQEAGRSSSGDESSGGAATGNTSIGAATDSSSTSAAGTSGPAGNSTAAGHLSGAGNTTAAPSNTPAGNSTAAGHLSGAGNTTAAPSNTPAGNSSGAAPPSITPAGNSSGAAPNSITPAGNSSGAAPNSITPAGNSSGAAPPSITPAGNSNGSTGVAQFFTVGQEAFVWGSPLVTFFRQQATRAALNAFSYANTTAVVGTTTVALPNVDTVYGGSFLDLRDQPMVFKTPNMGAGRYYSAGFFQTYGPAFSVNGSRANGPGPNTFTIVGPNWDGELPADLAPTVITSPTDDVLLLMRVVVSENVSNDIATVLSLYSQVSLQALSEALGGPAIPPLPNPPLPSSNLSEALQRLTLIGEGLQRDPPVNNIANNRVVRMLATINVTRQYGFDPYSVTQQQAAALEAARQTTDAVIRAANVIIQINDSIIQSENFWASSLSLLDHDLNTEFLYRATLTAPGGIGGLPPTEVVYFLTFLAEATPPVGALLPANATISPNATIPPSTPATTPTPSNITGPPVNPFDPPSSTATARANQTSPQPPMILSPNANQTSPQPPIAPSPSANLTTLQPQMSSPHRFRPFIPLQGSRCFRLRLTPPPVDSFWSVTLYNASSLNLLENVTKFGVGDRTPGLLYNPDRTVTIYIQPTSPGQSLDANWIPTVNATNSAVVVRAYGPSPQILNESYEPEAIQLSPTCEI
ncbi:hypothetical protein CLOP_g23394 [Closterium sp. NIES-67]|nr:hypothetical protein CLOP_g23394 [Closterium sp. NIES-67]